MNTLRSGFTLIVLTMLNVYVSGQTSSSYAGKTFAGRAGGVFRG